MPLLSPVSAETLSLTIADWQIWERWYLTFKNGQLTADTDPCFPLERELNLTLQRQLTTRFVLDEHAMFAATAIFQYNSNGGSGKPRYSSGMYRRAVRSLKRQASHVRMD